MTDGSEAVGARKPWKIYDRQEKLVCTHTRYEKDDGGKGFTWRLPDRDKDGLFGLKPADLPLYGIHLIDDFPERVVIVTEGEKAADALQERGLLAVATVTGAPSVPSHKVLEDLRDRHVLLWPDADLNEQLGKRHMQLVAIGIWGVAKSIAVLEWEDAPDHGDAADFAGSDDELQTLMESQRPIATCPSIPGYEPPRAPSPLRFTPPARAWVETKPPPRKYLIHLPTRNDKECAPGTGDGLIPRGKVTLLSSEGGAGKTTAIVQLAIAVAAGEPWLGHFHVGKGPSRVLMLLGEEDAGEVHRRIFYACEAMKLDTQDRELVLEHLVVLPLSGKTCPLLSASGDVLIETGHLLALRELLDEHAGDEGWGLIGIDPLSRFSGIDAEADNQFATRFVETLETLTEVPGNPSVLVCAHSSKFARRAGEADVRGVTGLTDAARCCLALTNKRQKLVELSTLKTNYSLPLEPVMLERRKGGTLFVESEADRERRDADKTAETNGRDEEKDQLEAKRIEEVARELLQKFAEADRSIAFSAEKIVALAKRNRRRALRAVTLLEVRGLIKNEGKPTRPNFKLTTNGELAAQNGDIGSRT